MTLMQQFIVGLNPNDFNSLFQFVGILPVQQGVQVQWSSVADITDNSARLVLIGDGLMPGGVSGQW
jgi:glycogen synthase